MHGRVAEEMTEERKEVIRAPRAANLTGTVTGTGNTGKGNGRSKSETRYCYDCGERGISG